MGHDFFIVFGKSIKMENLLFTTAYILIVLWIAAILIAAATTIWNMSGLSGQFGTAYQYSIRMIRKLKNLEAGRLAPSIKRLIHN